jgi:HAD superfamily hydrolase (TIGR01509 family)
MKILDRFGGFLFDLDGVLVNSYVAWFHLINEGLRLQNRPEISEPQFQETWGQGIEADQEAFFPDWSLEQIVDFYNSHFPNFSQHVKQEPEVILTLAGLKAAGKRFAVASNSPAEIIRELLRQGGMTSYVDAYVGADEVKASKPAPNLLFRAAEKLSIPISQACYIGDSSFDEEAARAAEIFFIGYKREGQIRIETLSDLLKS